MSGKKLLFGAANGWYTFSKYYNTINIKENAFDSCVVDDHSLKNKRE